LSDHAERFFLITGGPGSGKSTLIEALRRAGYTGMAEAGRVIIRDQMEVGGNGLPWSDPILFAELMLSWDVRTYHMAEQTSGTVFFDRGVVDVAGYLRLLGMAVPKHMEKAVDLFRYNKRVFIAPPWEPIFEQDRERKQDFAEAVRTYEALVTSYQKYGYELIELPQVSVEQREQFVLERIGGD